MSDAPGILHVSEIMVRPVLMGKTGGVLTPHLQLDVSGYLLESGEDAEASIMFSVENAEGIAEGIARAAREVQQHYINVMGSN